MPPRFRFRSKQMAAIGGGSGHGYTVTHYVAPFASVSGASSDEEDRGATAWTNAAAPGGIATPTTLGTAMARAAAGNVVQCAAGTYVGTATLVQFTPCWYPINSGTAGNPIVIVAATPAATNRASEASLSKLSNGTPNEPPASGAYGAVYGGRGAAGALTTHFVIWDGFWTDQLDGAYPQSSNGQCVIGGESEGMKIRRGLFDRASIPGDDNFAAIFCQNCIDVTISDCFFRGGTSFNGSNDASHNDAAISLYGVDNITIEYCQSALNPNNGDSTVGCGVFVKAFQGGRGNSGIIRHCRFVEGISTGRGIGIEMNGLQAADGGVEVAHCICQGGHHAWGIIDATDGDKTVNVHHNTFVDSLRSLSGGAASVVKCRPMTNDDEVTFANNIVVHLADTDMDHGLVITESFDLDQCAQWDWNLYFHAGATAKFRDEPTDFTSLAAWQAHWGGTAEDNSSYGDPDFVNYATGDFHLSPGSPALTASSTGGPVGAYTTGSEEIGLRANPTY